MSDTYHLDYSRDSNSSLSLFRFDIEKYAAIRVHRTLKPDEPTPAMAFGSMVHTLVLEPEKFEAEYIVGPDKTPDRRTKAGKDQWAEFLDAAANKAIVEAEDYRLAVAMREAIMTHPKARQAIEAEGWCEHQIEWDDDGCPLKMRADKILSNGLVVDLKTTDDPSPDGFSRTAHKFGYYRQASLYLDGAATKGHDGPFVFVVVGKSAPHSVGVYTLDDDALRLGWQHNHETIAELMDRRERGDWSARWGTGIVSLSLPRWAVSV